MLRFKRDEHKKKNNAAWNDAQNIDFGQQTDAEWQQIQRTFQDKLFACKRF